MSEVGESRGDPPLPTYAAIILAGGRSQRMGRPKAWLELGGRPLLVQVALRVQPLVREIVIVAAPGQELPVVELPDAETTAPDGGPSDGPRCRVEVVHDRIPGLGPLPALARGLETIQAPYAFALACDAPLVRRSVLELLARDSDDASAVVPIWNERPQPLVAIYHRRLAPQLTALAAAGERRLQAVVQLPGVRILEAERLRTCDPGGISFHALNTPEDYAAVRAAWSRETAETP